MNEATPSTAKAMIETSLRPPAPVAFAGVVEVAVPLVVVVVVVVEFEDALELVVDVPVAIALLLAAVLLAIALEKLHIVTVTSRQQPADRDPCICTRPSYIVEREIYILTFSPPQ